MDGENTVFPVNPVPPTFWVAAMDGEQVAAVSMATGSVWDGMRLSIAVKTIIIPMKNGYFIGNIPNIFRQTHMIRSWYTLW